MDLETETVAETSSRGARPWVAAEVDRAAVWDAMLVPAWLTSLQPDYFLSYRLEPLGLRSTRVVADVFVHQAGPDDAPEVLSFWDRTNAEDRAIVARQQRGVAAPSFEPGRYAAGDDGVHAFERRVAAAHLEIMGLDP
jgi:phenylpropionate dioxygenase-like ring-hydroxylating dioxygenase large terminal subunit